MSPLSRLRAAFARDPVTWHEVGRVAAFWLAVGLAYQSLRVVNMAAWGDPRLGPVIVLALAGQNLAFIPASLVLRRAARLWVARPQRGRTASTGAVVVGLLVASYASWNLLALFARPLLDAWLPALGFAVPQAPDARTHLSSLLDAFWPFLLMAVYYTAAAYRTRAAEREQAALALEAELARAQVKTLRMQLNPHFLFNTLNVVSGLVEERPRHAQDALAKLSGLLRGALRDQTADATLADEVAWLCPYIELQRLRFEDRLDVDLEVDADVADVQVPGFLLQPLVENAFEHGVARVSRRGRVSIRGQRQDGRLVLDVLDNGPGLEGAPAASDRGLGIATTRERLRRLYDDRATFELADRTDGPGTRARIVLPLYTS